LALAAVAVKLLVLQPLVKTVLILYLETSLQQAVAGRRT
jgi:hypothetical protein